MVSDCIRYLFAAIAGACIGFAAFVVAGNVERTPYFAIRQSVTGKDALSEVVSHPFDAWITIVILICFVGSGALAALSIVWFRRR